MNQKSIQNDAALCRALASEEAVNHAMNNVGVTRQVFADKAI